MAAAIRTTFVKCHLGLYSISWGSVSDYFSFIVVIELSIVVVSVLKEKCDAVS